MVGSSGGPNRGEKISLPNPGVDASASSTPEDRLAAGAATRYGAGMDTPHPPWKHLTPKRNSLYKQLFVNGRIATWVLYSCYTPGEDCPGRSVEEIAADYDLPVEAVREAIAYYESDPPEMREDLEREQALIEASGANDPAARGRATKSISLEDYARILRR